MCYITFTILYNVPENFLVDIFLKFRTGKVTLLSQNELVLPRGQNDSTLLSVFLVLKKATGFPGNATTCYILFEYFQQVGKTTNIYLIFPTFRPKNFSQKGRFYIVQNYHDFRSEIVIILWRKKLKMHPKITNVFWGVRPPQNPQTYTEYAKKVSLVADYMWECDIWV